MGVRQEGIVVRDAQLKDLEDARTFGVGPPLLADMSRGQLALMDPVRVLEGEERRRQVTPGELRLYHRDME